MLIGKEKGREKRERKRRYEHESQSSKKEGNSLSKNIVLYSCMLFIRLFTLQESEIL